MNIFIMNGYISKSYTRSKNTIYRVGAAVVSTITSYHSFYCFRDRVVPCCLGILCIAWAKFSGRKTWKDELVYALTESMKSSIILKDSLII